MSPSNTTGPGLWSVDGRGIAAVTLNRPEVNNAYNGELIQGLLAALDALGGVPVATPRASTLHSTGPVAFDGCIQIRSGNRMMKLSRFGIFTAGRVLALITSFSPMILLRARIYAVSA